MRRVSEHVALLPTPHPSHVVFYKVLVAIDGSPHAKLALHSAVSIASQYDASLTVCHVKETGPIPKALSALCDSDTESAFLLPNIARDMSGKLAIADRHGHFETDEEGVREALAQFLVNQAMQFAKDAGIKKVSSKIETGPPADSILRCVSANGIDLIVLGRRGLSELKGIFVGSVSHRVESHSDCACLTVKA